jgi:hypothetical protein
MNLTKRQAIRSKAIRNAANGEPCAVCGRNDGTTVFCHLNEGWAGKGMGQKADDIAGFFGCARCHDDYDCRRRVNPITDWMVMRAVYRTLRRLWELGIIKVNP